ncbi:MAG: hypothetical protein LBQ30_02130 [Treponema sp.]|jgi:hypothetical protein|nr:hypothetical protein [Treponema sp.]
MKKKLWSLLFLFVGSLVFFSCENPAGTEPGEINWEPEPNGTLTIINNVSKDMVLFQGQTPSSSNIIGGVRGSTTKPFDISDDVEDFDVGGYIILRGMTLDEYTKNKTNLSNGKIEYSAMATYGRGQKFRAEINPLYSGDYYFKATNFGKIGMELRKNSPDGEKIGYLPALATNYEFYSSSPSSMTIFPVYVYYNNVTKKVTTIRATSFADSVSIGPRPVTDQAVSTVLFPNDPQIKWDQIAASIVYPVAFITVTNGVTNQDSRLAAASRVYFAQNGYDSINSGETLTFEVTATNDGQQINLNCILYGGTTTVAVKTADGTTPIIKNGYDYTVNLAYSGSGGLTDPTSYTAVITEGTKRDILSEIISL